MQKVKTTSPLAAEQVEQLQAMISGIGIRDVADLLGLAPRTISHAALGGSVRAATRQLLVLRLAAFTPSTTSARSKATEPA